MSGLLLWVKREKHTLICCVSAAGYALPPFLIYPRKRISEKLKEECLPQTVFACSDNGWITKEIYLHWFKFFIANISPNRPVLLIEDGHASRISVEVIELARENNIHLLCLPSHTTHLLQPLNVGVFKALKSFYSKECSKYLANNPGRVITTDIIASLFAKAWPLSVTPVNMALKRQALSLSTRVKLPTDILLHQRLFISPKMNLLIAAVQAMQVVPMIIHYQRRESSHQSSVNFTR